MKKLALLCMLVLSTCILTQTSSSAGDRVIFFAQGFLTGADFLNMSEDQRQLHTIGFYNGVTMSPFFVKEGGDYVDWFKRLPATGLRVSDMRKMITEYIQADPARAKQALNTLCWEALKKGLEKTESGSK